MKLVPLLFSFSPRALVALLIFSIVGLSLVVAGIAVTGNVLNVFEPRRTISVSLEGEVQPDSEVYLRVQTYRRPWIQLHGSGPDAHHEDLYFLRDESGNFRVPESTFVESNDARAVFRFWAPGHASLERASADSWTSPIFLPIDTTCATPHRAIWLVGWTSSDNPRAWGSSSDARLRAALRMEKEILACLASADTIPPYGRDGLANSLESMREVILQLGGETNRESIEPNLFTEGGPQNEQGRKIRVSGTYTISVEEFNRLRVLSRAHAERFALSHPRGMGQSRRDLRAGAGNAQLLAVRSTSESLPDSCTQSLVESKSIHWIAVSHVVMEYPFGTWAVGDYVLDAEGNWYPSLEDPPCLQHSYAVTY